MNMLKATFKSGMKDVIQLNFARAALPGVAGAKLPGWTPVSPVINVLGNDLHMVVTGMGGGIYHGWVDLDTDAFSGWTKLWRLYRQRPDTDTTTLNTLFLFISSWE